MGKAGFVPVIALAIVTVLAGCHQGDEVDAQAANGNLAPGAGVTVTLNFTRTGAGACGWAFITADFR